MATITHSKNNPMYRQIKIQFEMKQLLSLSRDKKQQPNLKPSLPPPKPVFQDEEVTEEEILAFAEMIGIVLPGDEDLLYLAREGIMAEVPREWEVGEFEDGNIIYINKQTGEEQNEHPCDDYYRRLVAEEKRKKGKKKGGFPPSNLQIMPPKQQLAQNQQFAPKQFAPKQSDDPLVKMQQEKEQRKAEDSLRKDFADKKTTLKNIYQAQKEALTAELKVKQQKTKTKYEEEQQNQRTRIAKKASEKDREEQEKIRRELNTYEQEVRLKIESNLRQKKAQEREAVEKKIKQEKQDAKRRLEEELRIQKKRIDEECRAKMKAMQQEQKKWRQQNEEGLLEREGQKLKNEIVRRRMKEHSSRLQDEAEKQKEIYRAEVARLQSEHQKRVNLLQGSAQPAQRVRIEDIIADCEKQEKEDLKAFQFELTSLRQTLLLQNQSRLEQYRRAISQQTAAKLKIIAEQFADIIRRYQNAKEQDYQQKIWDAEKRAKDDYLRALKGLEKQFVAEEEVARMDHAFQPQTLHRPQFNTLLEQIRLQEDGLRREMEGVRLEIQNIEGQHNSSPESKLTEGQLRLYQLIQSKIKSGARKD